MLLVGALLTVVLCRHRNRYEEQRLVFFLLIKQYEQRDSSLFMDEIIGSGSWDIAC